MRYLASEVARKAAVRPRMAANWCVDGLTGVKLAAQGQTVMDQGPFLPLEVGEDEIVACLVDQCDRLLTLRGLEVQSPLSPAA